MSVVDQGCELFQLLHHVRLDVPVLTELQERVVKPGVFSEPTFPFHLKALMQSSTTDEVWHSSHLRILRDQRVVRYAYRCLIRWWSKSTSCSRLTPSTVYQSPRDVEAQEFREDYSGCTSDQEATRRQYVPCK